MGNALSMDLRVRFKRLMDGGMRAAEAGCVFRAHAPSDSDLIRPPIPTTCAHLFRAIRPPLTRCLEA